MMINVEPFLNALRELTVVDGVYRVYIEKLVDNL